MSTFANKSVVLVLAMLFLTLCFAAGVCFFPEIQKNQRLLARKYQIESEIKAQEDRNRELEHKIERALHDPVFIESLAREILHYSRPGETVFVFEPPRSPR